MSLEDINYKADMDNLKYEKLETLKRIAVALETIASVPVQPLPTGPTYAERFYAARELSKSMFREWLGR